MASSFWCTRPCWRIYPRITNPWYKNSLSTEMAGFFWCTCPPSPSKVGSWRYWFHLQGFHHWFLPAPWWFHLWWQYHPISPLQRVQLQQPLTTFYILPSPHHICAIKNFKEIVQNAPSVIGNVFLMTKKISNARDVLRCIWPVFSIHLVSKWLSLLLLLNMHSLIATPCNYLSFRARLAQWFETSSRY